MPSETVPTTAARKATRNHLAAKAAKDFLDLTTGNYRMPLARRRNLNAPLRDVKRTVAHSDQPVRRPTSWPARTLASRNVAAGGVSLLSSTR